MFFWHGVFMLKALRLVICASLLLSAGSAMAQAIKIAVRISGWQVVKDKGCDVVVNIVDADNFASLFFGLIKNQIAVVSPGRDFWIASLQVDEGTRTLLTCKAKGYCVVPAAVDVLTMNRMRRGKTARLSLALADKRQWGPYMINLDGFERAMKVCDPTLPEPPVDRPELRECELGELSLSTGCKPRFGIDRKP
jgi:hypothetical protein